MSLTDNVEAEVLDKLYGGTDFTPPASYYIGLFTTNPGDDGTGGTEVSGSGYARVQVVNNVTNFPAASGGSKSNGTVITFPAASGGSWGTVVGFGLFDAASGGNLLGVGTISPGVLISDGETRNFPIGNLSFTLD